MGGCEYVKTAPQGCKRANEDDVHDLAGGFGQCRWVGRVGKKDERQEMPAARPSCAHDTQTWFVVLSTSVGPVGHCKKKTIPA